jgi:hypothetical protein
VVHVYNPSTGEAEVGGLQVQVSLEYIARPCLKRHESRGGDYLGRRRGPVEGGSGDKRG